jgi:twitching motility two-component system response regulator PilG
LRKCLTALPILAKAREFSRCHGGAEAKSRRVEQAGPDSQSCRAFDPSNAQCDRNRSERAAQRDINATCVAMAALTSERKRNPMENLATTGAPRLSGLKVLVIDDSKTIRRTAETLLTKEGCEVFTAVDGFDALSKIADHQPDIVFVDIMMPRLDGYQTCSLIKHNKVFRSIPVIMLSSKDGLFDRARGRIVGSEHYLTKPFTKDELLNAIETHVGALAR